MNPEILGNLDFPNECAEIFGNSLVVRGWAFSTNTKEDLLIEIWVDESLVSKGATNENRTDVVNVYPSSREASHTGFSIESDLSKFGYGNHRMKVIARSKISQAVIGSVKFSNKNLETTINDFHKLYYNHRQKNVAWERAYWLGVQTLKCPLDMWIYQEIIFELKPDLIIETGTWNGGSALFIATMMDIINNGRVISIDVEKRERPIHPRITYITGSSIDPEIVNKVKETIDSKIRTVLVILDSDHRKDHVIEEMRIYGKLVTKDSYLIVEDTNLNSHPVVPEHGPGPMEAVLEFLKENNEFVIDDGKEKFFMTFNPRGYLKKVKK